MRLPSSTIRLYRKVGVTALDSSNLCRQHKKFLHMTMAAMGEHMDRTSGSFRAESSSKATVISVTNASQNVKSLMLKVQNPNLTFKAGQWVDFRIPEISEVGGFSICSSPLKLKLMNLLELAVKSSDAAPATWVHEKCHLGSEVTVRVGGDFFYDPLPTDAKSDLLLIAGGIGINPLYSMIQHAADLIQSAADGDSTTPVGSILLLYSAETKADLIHKKTLMMLAEEFPNIKVKLYTTKSEEGGTSDVEVGRIDEEKLKTALSNLDTATTQCYICGPLAMIEDVQSYLLKLGLKDSQIKFEKWA